MDYLVYKVIHLAGVICLFAGLGAALAHGEGRGHINRLVAILHGVGLVLLLVSGFGIQAKLGLGFPVWLIVKIALWIVMGAMLTIGRRTALGPTRALLIAIVLGAVLAFLGVYKPGASQAAPAKEPQSSGAPVVSPQ